MPFSAVHNKAAAHVILFAHALDVFIAVAQRLHGRILAGGGRTHDGGLVDLCHHIHDGLRPAGIAEAPARHGVRLGKAVYHHSALFHAGQRGEADMARAAVGELGVYLVREHHDVCAAQHLGNGLQVFPAHHGAAGVAREGQHQQLRPRRNGRPSAPPPSA